MLAKMITVEMGKLMAHVDGETILSTDTFDHYVSNTESFLADKILYPTNGQALITSKVFRL